MPRETRRFDLPNQMSNRAIEELSVILLGVLLDIAHSRIGFLPDAPMEPGLGWVEAYGSGRRGSFWYCGQGPPHVHPAVEIPPEFSRQRFDKSIEEVTSVSCLEDIGRSQGLVG